MSSADTQPINQIDQPTSIKITVKLFAAFQEALASSEIILDLPPDSSAVSAYEKLTAVCPKLEQWRFVTRFAINLRFVEPLTLLKDGDEVALIPPVSGG